MDNNRYSINQGDFLDVSFFVAGGGYEEVTSVTSSVVNGHTVYAVVTASGTFNCQDSNTVLERVYLNGVQYWVIGA